MYRSKAKGRHRYSLFRDCEEMAAPPPWIEVDALHRIGVARLDRQHQKLVRLANTLNDAVKAGRSMPTVRHLFDQLVRYLRHHFSTEEQLMQRHGYPDYGTHGKAHAGAILEIARLRERLEHGAEFVALQAIKDWLVDHVRTMDRPMGEFLSRIGELH